MVYFACVYFFVKFVLLANHLRNPYILSCIYNFKKSQNFAQGGSSISCPLKKLGGGSSISLAKQWGRARFVWKTYEVAKDLIGKVFGSNKMCLEKCWCGFRCFSWGRLGSLMGALGGLSKNKKWLLSPDGRFSCKSKGLRPRRPPKDPNL